MTRYSTTRAKDRTGQRYGVYLVKFRAENVQGTREAAWALQCEACGYGRIVRSNLLSNVGRTCRHDAWDKGVNLDAVERYSDVEPEIVPMTNEEMSALVAEFSKAIRTDPSYAIEMANSGSSIRR